MLDLGCGTARVLDFLPPLEYHGLDSNPAYIRFAQKKWKGRASFVCTDLCGSPWPVQGLFDRVMAAGVLHHLSDEEARKMLENARRLLKPHGKLVSFDGCYEEHQSPAARALLSMDRGKYVRNEKSYLALAHSVFRKASARIERRFLRLPYSHLIMEMTAD